MELDGFFLDMYGTLTTGDRDAVEAVCAEIVRDTGIAISAHELSITWGERFLNFLDFCNGDDFMTAFDVERKTLRETMSMLGVTLDSDPYCRRLQDYWRNPPLQPDTLAFLAEVPCPVCIVSNADHDDVEEVVRRHGLRVDRIVTSESAKYYKPHRRIFDEALTLTGWRRECVVHAGDSLHSDVGGAIVAGIKCAWIRRARRIHDIGTHSADFEFSSLMELCGLI